jgi:hypothetical protein
MKIRPVEQSCSVLTDGGTYMEKVIIGFRNISRAIQRAHAVCKGLTEGTMKITNIWGKGCDLVDSCRRFERNCHLHLQDRKISFGFNYQDIKLFRGVCNEIPMDVV